ncbi:MAG: alpha-L-rhamnosidase N-terminal domain-containing protein [Tannerella sp.]|jgi:hypothetical protein|nr:alpha-L-rhamnosidase N-terminal domain-containing protein [Tannerella sp.]
MKNIKSINIRKMSIMTVILVMLLPSLLKAQTVDPLFLRRQWEAQWIMVPETGAAAYGVYLFRKSFETETTPASFPIYVSGDNRYKLYVNEQLVSLGPARCDVEHWNFETVDLAPYLQAGRNIVSAKVWNEGDKKAEAQASFRTGFILQGATEDAKVLNTDNTWTCIRDSSYSIPTGERSRGYSVVPPNEQVDMRIHIRGWEKLSYDDASWKQAQPISRGTPKNTIGIDANKTWRLVPSTLPQMELQYQRLVKVRKAEGVTVPSPFPSEKAAIRVPANTTASILLDQTFLTNAYPTLILKGGKNGTVTLTYAESLYNSDFSKDNRNETEGKNIVGKSDVIISDGSDDQCFTALSYRTYRYVNIRIETKETPLVIDDFYGTFTGYPFRLNAKLETESAELRQIFETGWRTARLCAVETYMDCPYYEQLQYIGDTRIQALVSLYNSGDDRLVKSMLMNIDNSRQPEGITLSRYPTVNPQIIPTFTLWYIGMLHDYMMYGGDREFIINKLPGERQIMDYFNGFQDTDGSLKNLPNWAFVDWTFGTGWMRGMGPVGEDGSSALLDLQLLIACRDAADLEQHVGMDGYASLYRERAAQLVNTIREKYWDESRKLFADTPEKLNYSQHANSLAILSGLVTGQDAREMGQTLLSDTTLTQASIYFKYYLHQALIKAGMGDDYLDWLDIWRRNIELGLTTWAETSNVERARSDCHAWGASPNIEFFRTILGIESASPNFKEVRIEPHLGTIKKIGGAMPHPAGDISVKYDRTGRQFNVEIVLPAEITGAFVWEGKEYPLKTGENRIKL